MLSGASCTMRSGIVPPPEDIVSSPKPVLFQRWGVTQSPATFGSSEPVLNDYTPATIFSQGYFWQYDVEPITELPFLVWHNDFDILPQRRLEFYLSSPSKGVALEQPPRVGCVSVRMLPAVLLDTAGSFGYDFTYAFQVTDDVYALQESSGTSVPVFQAGSIVFSTADQLLAIADANAPYFIRSHFQPITFSIQTEWA
jgi:hypothetical protein